MAKDPPPPKKKQQEIVIDLKMEVKERKELKEYWKDGMIDDNHGTFVRSGLGERWYFQFPYQNLS